MLKNKLFFLMISALTLGGCTQTIDGDDYSSSSLSTASGETSGSQSGSNSSDNGSTSSSSDSSSDNSSSLPDDIEEDDGCPIAKVIIPESQLFLNKNEHSNALTSFSYTVKDGVNKTEIDEIYTFSWSSSDESIVKVGTYGQLDSYNNLGKAIVTLTLTVNGKSRQATCRIDVVNSKSSVQKVYRKVTDVSTLVDKDVIVIGCQSKNVVAGLDNLHMYLHPVSMTLGESFNESALPEDAASFFLFEDDEYSNVFKLQNQDGQFLAATNVSKVAFVNKTGNVKWAFEQESDGAYISSTSAIMGQIMYNAHDDGTGGKFSIYDSTPQFDMLLPTIYRLEIVLP